MGGAPTGNVTPLHEVWLLFFGGSRDVIQKLGEGICLPEFSSRFDAKMPWTTS